MINTDLKNEKLKSSYQKDLNRMEQLEKDKRTMFAQTVYLGTVGIVIVLPIVGGAYLGKWMDNKVKGFSFSWTVSLIVFGVFIGGINAYLFVKRNE